MKKKLFYIVVCVVIVFLLVFNFCGCYPIKINISDNAAAKIVYKYDDENIDRPLNEDDALIIRDIFNGKELFRDNPSCGFDTNISLRFDNSIFSVACDGCSIIKYKNRYFNLSETQIEQIHNIMKKYGAHFPCV